MNVKIEKLVRLFLTTLLLVLFSCSEEIYEDNVHSHTKDKNSITFEQFKTETGITNFKTHISIEQPTGAVNARTASGEYGLSDFIIDTEIIKRLEINQETTYSFKVYPVNQELLVAKEYYNLVYEKEGNKWNQLIFKNTEKEIIIQGQAELENSQMIYNSKMIEGGLHATSFMCATISIDNVCPKLFPCTKDWCDGCNICFQVRVSYMPCNDGGGLSSPGNGNPSGPDNGGSEGPAPSENTGEYSPNPYDQQDATSFMAEHQVQVQTPCDQMKNLKNKANFVSKMTEVKNNIGGTKEKGFMLLNMQNNECSNIVEGDSEGNLNYPLESLTQNELYNFIGTAHNHLEDEPTHIGVFTPEDLPILWSAGAIETSPQNPYHAQTPEKAIIFVITNKGLFSLKINDLSKLHAFIMDYDSWSIEKTEEYMKDVFKNPAKYNITHNATHDEQVKGFLRFMRDNDLGVDLYEGDKDTFGDWKKLTLTDNGNNNFAINEQPCNP